MRVSGCELQPAARLLWLVWINSGWTIKMGLLDYRPFLLCRPFQDITGTSGVSMLLIYEAQLQHATRQVLTECLIGKIRCPHLRKWESP